MKQSPWPHRLGQIRTVEKRLNLLSPFSVMEKMIVNLVEVPHSLLV